MSALDLETPGRVGRLRDIARHVATAPESWGVTPRFDPASRWFTRLFAAADHEAWLLTWLPGQSTDLHDHGGSAGTFVVVSGELTEETVHPGAAGAAVLRSASFAAGDARPFGSQHVHRIVNTSAQPAVSLHVYGPALTQMTRYRLQDGALRVLEIDRAGVAW
ncbi:mannose-6-phosphate isomerase-like protein (cupin superfamily) [Catenuloplanes nepalensis]|uniref:Mannose-6-phosphate isomerase-like protein (Cupin superfamily) n=1 Tax=Catenuloplanes nepalensis TaxID=587533 RepID=A0ABT9MWD9_9ACTN|nr:cysteine dioxygenase family protein [Catenuloplanes nepalensis]MDP9795755.1 mannose-6-phosphate isomerase-like protein (cupin superfamily) [Catenuloplanes nepalensis]